METDREKILQIFVAESKDHLREMEESLLTQALNKGEITMSARLDTIDQVQYLSFHIAGEEYAIPVLRVKEIIEYERHILAGGQDEGEARAFSAHRISEDQPEQ